MSIWTDLLIRHGHIATPTALALIAPVPRAAPSAGPPQPSPRPAGDADNHPAGHVPHPLRTVGQLR
ncbi:MAG TPA: hypothetical protein VGD37_12495 [Kofleriaceae bacterium]|jgi:hypothetical protein